jgi:hypothetical protein
MVHAPLETLEMGPLEYAKSSDRTTAAVEFSIEVSETAATSKQKR